MKRLSLLLLIIAGCATAAPASKSHHLMAATAWQSRIDTNQVQFHKGTPPAPDADAIAIITKDGTNLLQQMPDGTTSILGGGGGGAVASVASGGGCTTVSPTTGAVVVTSTGCLTATSNLSDLTNAATARTNLGLGTLATQSGTFSGTSSGTNTGDQTITLTGDVTGSGTGSFGAVVNSAANLFTVGTGATGVKPQFRNPDNSATFAQLDLYPASGANINFELALIPRGNGHADIALFGTDEIANITDLEFLLIQPTGTAYQFLATKAGAGVLRPINIQVTAGGAAAADTGLTISATNNNLSMNSNYIATAKAGTAVTAQANGTVWLQGITPPTQASATSAKLDAYKWAALTATLTGTTAVTTAAGFNFIDVEAPTITDASAVTVTNAATFTIKGAPIAAGSATITNPYALWVQGGTLRLDGSGGFTDPPIVINNGDVSGIAITLKGGASTVLENAGNGINLQSTTGAISFTTSATVLQVTAAGGVALGTSATLALGAATLAANGSVATVLTGVGPTGSHTTVQEWMLVKGTGAANRWIPMF